MAKIKFSPEFKQEVDRAEREWCQILKEKTGALSVALGSIEHPPLDGKMCMEYDADFVGFLYSKKIPIETV